MTGTIINILAVILGSLLGGPCLLNNNGSLWLAIREVWQMQGRGTW